MSEYIENMKKRFEAKKTVKDNIDTKIENTKKLADNYAALVVKHQDTSARYAGVLTRMAGVLEDAQKDQSELDGVVADLSSFDENHPYVSRYGSGGSDNLAAYEARESILQGLYGRQSDLSTKIRQAEKLMNKIYYDR